MWKPFDYFYTPVNKYIYILNCKHKYFSILYSSIENHNCFVLSFSDRTLAASGAFWLKPTIYSANLISSGSNKIVVLCFSDDCCYSTTYPGYIVTLWTFWECFVDLPLVVVAAVTIDWQVVQLWLGHKNGGDKTLWRHVEAMNKLPSFKKTISLFALSFQQCNFADIVYAQKQHYTLTKVKKV